MLGVLNYILIMDKNEIQQKHMFQYRCSDERSCPVVKYLWDDICKNFPQQWYEKRPQVIELQEYGMSETKLKTLWSLSLGIPCK